ncbi:uncharacterized protein STEHIDRAFT_148905 [Stereum hirsutum FP-91666 SS1]|uniref:uncharacterized protein n=1 Tax=Stereum hirsutum (strain FP-91666) TaxID=721885 RepID=UPI0004449613|nr:uncharacterized protein STEHIDRAFT_148905 [Stereum hirsutum FP-91666 SS1]EIM83354.1 hypothetical protein STEHIDRAFT_148905 [Stereum hirsutum FP-91666 SS1]
MSSFKRRVPSTKPSTSTSQTPSIPSTSEPPSISTPESASPHPSSLSSHPSLRPSPTSSSTLLTSTGLPSLDDILGGGLPLSCSFLVLAPDVHSAYGELVCKYAVSMGLAGGMAVWVVGGQGNIEEKEWVEECMWMPGVGGLKAGQGQEQAQDDGEKETDGEDGEGEEGSKIKIAWRYEQMKKFQTTVNASNASNEDFCRTFDLTNRIPPIILSQARKSSLLHTLPLPLPLLETPSSCESHNITSMQSILRKLKEMLERSDAQIPVRICVPSLGSPEWGDLTPVDITRFLHTLRHLLRTHPHACATISLSPELSSETWGGQGWPEKLGWLSDGCVCFEAFSADPALTSLLPSHHGLLRILTLPNPHTLLPPSDRFSTLRGLGEAGGGGENNLAFRCLRKRMVVERLSLDVEGGVGERRTKKAGGEGTGVGGVVGAVEGRHEHGHARGAKEKEKAVARVEVRVDEGAGDVAAAKTDMDTAEKAKPKKERKKVAFRSDKPDLYDF